MSFRSVSHILLITMHHYQQCYALYKLISTYTNKGANFFSLNSSVLYISGMKSNAFRPGGYRKSRVFRKSFVYRDREKDLTDSGRLRETSPAAADPYTASRPWLK